MLGQYGFENKCLNTYILTLSRILDVYLYIERKKTTHKPLNSRHRDTMI